MKVIFGLGNPGKKYENTKHNVGFMAIDNLAKRLSVDVWKKAFDALVGEARYKNEKILLVKPETYMNLSGKAIWQVIDYYNDQIEKFIVVYDDMDTEFGKIRFRPKGSSGGHNGIKSIISSINSQDFDRLKIGIGQKKSDAVSHVLGEFSKQEKIVLEDTIAHALDAIEMWLDNDITVVMNKFNQK